MVKDAALLSTSDVVRLVFEETSEHLSPDAVRKWRRRGDLIHAERTDGGIYLFRANDVRRLLKRRRELKELRERNGEAK